MSDESSLDNPKRKPGRPKGTPQSPEAKAKIAAKLKGRKPSKDARILMSRAAKRRWSSMGARFRARDRALLKVYGASDGEQRARADEHRLRARAEDDRLRREAKAAKHLAEQQAILDSVDAPRPITRKQAEDMERLAEVGERREAQLVPDALRPSPVAAASYSVVEGLQGAELAYARYAVKVLEGLAVGGRLLGRDKKTLLYVREVRSVNEAGLAAIDALGAKLEER
jgi:hypothetical protein